MLDADEQEGNMHAFCLSEAGIRAKAGGRSNLIFCTLRPFLL